MASTLLSARGGEAPKGTIEWDRKLANAGGAISPSRSHLDSCREPSRKRAYFGTSGLYQQKVMQSHQAFDRDFRAVPSERPALPFEGPLH